MRRAAQPRQLTPAPRQITPAPRRAVLRAAAAFAALAGPGTDARGADGAARAPAAATRPAPTEPRPFPDAPAHRWPPVLPEPPMTFPRDHGAHPEHRTEWWYLTGWLQRPGEADAGFQLTFFRTRTAHPDANPSAFAPRQLLFAHAALALPERGRLLHAERAARAGFGIADAAVGDTRVHIGTGPRAWVLQRDPASDRYRLRLHADGFDADLQCTPDAPPLLQGEAGFSRKGPQPGQASRYYSRPQLAIEGTLGIDGRRRPVQGRAWFDHEWSSEILDAASVGWDWTGINLDDGGALMAFRLRDRDGRPTWQDATLRTGRAVAARTGLAPAFEPLRTWTSPRTAARWPVAMRVSVAGRTFDLVPLFDDQEIDARASTGTLYWEGAVTATEHGRRVGRGYLELTGYAGALRL